MEGKKPDYVDLKGTGSIRIFIERVPKEVFWGRINLAIAGCLYGKKPIVQKDENEL